jgi:hypothetical protein
MVIGDETTCSLRASNWHHDRHSQPKYRAFGNPSKACPIELNKVGTCMQIISGHIHLIIYHFS